MINSILKYRITLILALIVLLAGLIRFYKIDQFPVSLYWDEVSIAVNANFIAETGNDEYGNKFPILFKAFNDYKSPGNIYLTAIPVKIFGMNEFSARFTSAFLGTLFVLVMFFLGKNISKFAKSEINSDYFGLLAAFLSSISPWSIQFSRSGFESNSGLFFITLATTLFLIFLNYTKYKFYFLSALMYGISCYFYRSALIFSPLFFFFIILLNYKQLIDKTNIIKTILGILLFLLILIPFIPAMTSSEGMSRGNSVSIFNPQNSFKEVVEISNKLENSNKNIISKVIYNRRIVYANLFLDNYASYFTYSFLFKSGDSIERHNVLGMGQFYIWQLPFLLIGIFSIFFVRKKATLIIIAWLLLAAIPAGLSIPASHALRSLNMLPAFIIIVVSGIFIFFRILPVKMHLLIGLIISVIITVSFFNFISLYKRSAILYSDSWGDGYKQLMSYAGNTSEEYDKIVVSGHYWQPYSYALFYNNYDPNKYLKNGSRVGFGKFEFGGTSWEKEEELSVGRLEKYSKIKNVIFALSPSEYIGYKDNLEIIERIRNHNNELVFIIAKPK